MFTNDCKKADYGSYEVSLQECVEIFEKDHFPIPKFLRENDDKSLDFIIYYKEPIFKIPNADGNNGDFHIQIVFNVHRLDGTVNHIELIAISNNLADDNTTDNISLVSEKSFAPDFNMFEDNDPILDYYLAFKKKVEAFSLAS